MLEQVLQAEKESLEREQSGITISGRNRGCEAPGNRRETHSRKWAAKSLQRCHEDAKSKRVPPDTRRR